MTPSREMRNVAASVHQRLLNRAREQGVDFNLVLQRYAIERFLYRLGLSREVDCFTLKGATLFLVWAGEEFRPTRDVDLWVLVPRTTPRSAGPWRKSALCSSPRTASFSMRRAFG